MAKKKLIPEYQLSLGDEVQIEGSSIRNLYENIKGEQLTLISRLENAKNNKNNESITFSDVARNFVRRNADDIVSGELTFKQGIRSDNYINDIVTGTGYRLYKDKYDRGVLEIDDINVRGSLTAVTLTYDKVNAVGGTIIVSAAWAEITRVEKEMDAGYTNCLRCYYKPDGVSAQLWRFDDQLRIQKALEKTIYSTVRRVNYDVDPLTGEFWIDIYNISDGNYKIGTAIPEVGDTAVQWGNKNTDPINYPESIKRQSIIELSVLDGGKQTFYQNVDSFTLTDKNAIDIGCIDDKTQMRVYGDFFAGQRGANPSTYLKYDSTNAILQYKGRLIQIHSSINDSQKVPFDRGIFSFGTQYYEGDLVQNNGSTYYAKLDNIQIQTDNATYWKVYVSKGVDGASTFITYNSNAITNPPSTPTGAGNTDGWGYNSSGSTNWMSQKVANTISAGTWSVPILLKGQNGVDGAGVEFIFCRTSVNTAPDNPSINTVPNTGSSASKDLDDWFPVGSTSFGTMQGWFDDNAGVTSSYKYLWMSKREKKYIGGVYKWGDFSNPSFWTAYVTNGAKGDNGNGLETIYKITTVAMNPLETPDIDTYAANGWVNYIRGVDATNKFEYESQRIYSGGAWSGFTQAKLKNTYVKDGADAITLELSQDTVLINCNANGDIRLGQLPVTIVAKAYQGGVNKYVSDFAYDNPNSDITFTTSSLSSSYLSLIITALAIGVDESYIEISMGGINKRLTVKKVRDGYAGASLISRGAWTSGVVYNGNQNQVDVVSVTTSGVTIWYKAKKTAGTFTSTETPATDTTRWEAFDTVFQNIATGTLFAENANVGEFIFKGGRLYSQYPTDSTEKNLELDGVHGIIKALSGRIGNFEIKDGAIIGFDNNKEERLKLSPLNIPALNVLTAGGWIDLMSSNLDDESRGDYYNNSDYADNFSSVLETSETFTIPISAKVSADTQAGKIQSGVYTFINFATSIEYYQYGSYLTTQSGSYVTLAAGTYTVKIKSTLTFQLPSHGYSVLSIIHGNSRIQYEGAVKLTSLGLNGFYSIFSSAEYVYFKEGYGFEVKVGGYGLQVTSGGLKKLISGSWEDILT